MGRTARCSQVVGDLIQFGCSPEAVDTQGDTPLHHAARGGHVVVVDMMERGRALPRARNANQRTPLHEAAREGHADCISRLARAGFAVDQADLHGLMPLHYAVILEDIRKNTDACLARRCFFGR